MSSVFNLEPGDVAYVTASAPVRHKAPAADDGYVGVAIKQAIPGADTPRADRDLIAAGEGYVMLLKGKADVNAADVPAIAKGALVYITEATNAISNAAGAGKVVYGKVSELAGERGTPADKVRVNLELKV